MENTQQLSPERMHCMEIWGGNEFANKYFEAPGLDIFVNSVPYAESKVGGGDIYYLTSCASGRISRLLLADVSGHGESASKLAVSLRDLMRDNVNKISQEQFVNEMNRQFSELVDERGFATAVVATFFEPGKSLSFSVAGHPYPIYYRRATGRWSSVDPASLKTDETGNLPLGVHDESKYPGQKLSTSKGDMFLLYSDAFIESQDASGNMIGIEGLVQILNDLHRPMPHEIIPQLLEKIESLSNDNLQHDDATLILARCTTTKVRFRDNLLAPFRLLGKVGDSSNLID